MRVLVVSMSLIMLLFGCEIQIKGRRDSGQSALIMPAEEARVRPIPLLAPRTSACNPPCTSGQTCEGGICTEKALTRKGSS